MEIIESANEHGIRTRTENRTTLVKKIEDILMVLLKIITSSLKQVHISIPLNFSHLSLEGKWNIHGALFKDIEVILIF